MHELEYALHASGCRGIVSAQQLRTSNYLQMLQTIAPELATCERGRLVSRRLPMLQFVVRMGDERTPSMLGYDQVLARGAAVIDPPALDVASAALNRMTRSTSSSPVARRAIRRAQH